MGTVLESSYRQTADPEILAAAASGVDALIAASGTRAARVFELADIDPARVTDPDLRLNLVDYCRLMETASNQTGDALFGARFGRSFTPTNFKAVGALVVSSAKLGDGLRALARSYSWIQENSRLELTKENGVASLGYQIFDGRIVARQQDAELTISAFCSLIRHAVGRDWRPREIHFEHGAGGARRDYQSLFGASVFFDQPTNAIVFDERSLSTPMAHPDAHVFDHAVRFLETALTARSSEPATPLRASRDAQLGIFAYVIESQCKAGDVSIGAVARRLGLTVYAFRCRLRELRAPFDSLLFEVRRRSALHYVEHTERGMSEISLLLGYSEPSAFSRAFKAWTGQAPLDHRRAARR